MWNWLKSLLDIFRKPEPKPPAPVPVPDSEVPDRLHEHHNRERRLRALEDLVIVPHLMQAAQKHANWMARTGNLSHYGDGGSDLSERMLKEGYQPSAGGENIAWGQRNPQEVMADWMSSHGHKSNILNRYFKHVGYGVASGGGRLYWCVVFAVPGIVSTYSEVPVSLPDPIRSQD